MAKSFPRFQKTLAALLPLMFLWVSVACLSVCMGCETRGESGTGASSQPSGECRDDCAAECEGDAGEALGVVARNKGFCPIPDNPDGALQKGYAYEMKPNGGGQATPVGSVRCLVSVIKPPTAQSLTVTVVLKPPLERFGVLRI